MNERFPSVSARALSSPTPSRGHHTRVVSFLLLSLSGRHHPEVDVSSRIESLVNRLLYLLFPWFCLLNSRLLSDSLTPKVRFIKMSHWLPRHLCQSNTANVHLLENMWQRRWLTACINVCLRHPDVYLISTVFLVTHDTRLTLVTKVAISNWPMISNAWFQTEFHRILYRKVV